MKRFVCHVLVLLLVIGLAVTGQAQSRHDELPRAAWTDGVYEFGSDGGVTGVGRAEQALQYRVRTGDLKLGLQTQLRGVAFDDFDSYGVSLRYGKISKPKLGIAYNNFSCSDSLSAQLPGAESGHATALSLGVQWEYDRMRLALVYARQERNARVLLDTIAALFDADSIEFSAES